MTRDTFEAWLQDLGRPLPDGLGQDLSSRPQGSDWDFRSDLQRPGSQPGFALLVLPRRTQEPGTSGTNILGNLSKRSQKWFLGVREPTAPRTQEPSRSNPGTTPKSTPGATPETPDTIPKQTPGVTAKSIPGAGNFKSVAFTRSVHGDPPSAACLRVSTAARPHLRVAGRRPSHRRPNI